MHNPAGRNADRRTVDKGKIVQEKTEPYPAGSVFFWIVGTDPTVGNSDGCGVPTW